MNILVLTKIYPARDIPYSDTKVVHYFTKQWQDMGHNVQVVHNLILFPQIISWLMSLFLDVLTAKFGAVIPSFYDNKVRQYKYDGIDVIRIPIKKLVPHKIVRQKNVSNSFKIICGLIEKNHFKPDVIVAHWWSPQLELLDLLKQKYDCRTCMVVHDVDKSKKSSAYLKHFPFVDIWGFRSIPLQMSFQEMFGTEFNAFHCKSGIPEIFIVGNDHRKFDNESYSICYVGTLIERKYPITIMESVRMLPDNVINHIQYVGAGAELPRLKKYAHKHFMQDFVSFTENKIPRNEVSSNLQQSDIFVMVSRAEAFGLVYLEAMGCGCITIASRNEGMEGIIIHGVNGFLCEAGNANELSCLLTKIAHLSPKEKKRISDAAVKTARENTDYLAAKTYIQEVANTIN